VICEYSFTSRWPLAGLCGYGYTVAGGETTAYFASDLIHRVFHTDKLGEGVVGHYADTYDDCLKLAIDSPEEAVRNSASLRYFALDVYAYDIAAPGQGCTGHPPLSSSSSSAAASSSTASSVASSATAASATTAEASTTSSAPSVSLFLPQNRRHFCSCVLGMSHAFRW